ncbi:hypothetical protein MMC22_000838, partial [Lobaria immixta]|nr:hypothetical protein [Lobaria immixta]
VMPPAQILGVSEVASPVFPVVINDTVNPEALHLVDGEVQGVDYPELGPISPLSDSVFRLAGEHPFNDQFMPTTSTASFDPFKEDAFDAYHMSEVHDWSNSNNGWFAEFMK